MDEISYDLFWNRLVLMLLKGLEIYWIRTKLVALLEKHLVLLEIILESVEYFSLIQLVLMIAFH